MTLDSEGDRAEVPLDFSVEDSFVKAGQSGTYVFKPVVNAEARGERRHDRLGGKLTRLPGRLSHTRIRTQTALTPMTCRRCYSWGFSSRWLLVPWLGALLAALLLAGCATRGAAGQDTGIGTLLKRGRGAGMDATQMQMVARRARRAGLGAGDTASLLRPAVRLAEEGLPTGPLLAKTLEGLAKQVPLGRMRPTLRQQRASVQHAGQVVGQWTPVQKGSAQIKARDRLITAAADALRNGLRGEEVKAFLDGLPEEARGHPLSAGQVAVAVETLADLHGHGARPETARQLLTSAIRAGYDPESIRQLPSALQGVRREAGRPVGVLAGGAAKAIARGIPAATVLRGLFQGGLPGGGLPADVGPPGTTPGPGKLPETGPLDTSPPDNQGPRDAPPGGGNAGLL